MTALSLTPEHRTKLLTVFEQAETAAAWLAQEAEAELREAPNALDHPAYELWRIADSVAQELLDLREEVAKR